MVINFFKNANIRPKIKVPQGLGANNTDIAIKNCSEEFSTVKYKRDIDGYPIGRALGGKLLKNHETGHFGIWSRKLKGVFANFSHQTKEIFVKKNLDDAIKQSSKTKKEIITLKSKYAELNEEYQKKPSKALKHALNDTKKSLKNRENNLLKTKLEKENQTFLLNDLQKNAEILHAGNTDILNNNKEQKIWPNDVIRQAINDEPDTYVTVDVNATAYITKNPELQVKLRVIEEKSSKLPRVLRGTEDHSNFRSKPKTSEEKIVIETKEKIAKVKWQKKLKKQEEHTFYRNKIKELDERNKKIIQDQQDYLRYKYNLINFLYNNYKKRSVNESQPGSLIKINLKDNTLHTLQTNNSLNFVKHKPYRSSTIGGKKFKYKGYYFKNSRKKFLRHNNVEDNDDNDISE